MLLLGLAFLALRRRNEVLQDFLTPDEPDLEEEFFRVRSVPTEETPDEESADVAKEDEEAEAATNEAPRSMGGASQ